MGPILYRTALQSGPVDDQLIDQLLDSVGTWRDRDAAVSVPR